MVDVIKSKYIKEIISHFFQTRMKDKNFCIVFQTTYIVFLDIRDYHNIELLE